ncbi:pollen-specific leucine-rich repeat extensin 1 isoform X2 [Labeo rohita]|uniref:Pollen-specific leucine-rich repeat extensin 1 isoform X2 n=1 Tax=Labeo rohita TaxID=84645 RepID=A0A498LSI7_LABRO|nr:pollen-specific leucine-rich repeat extensin 1 isoform X2 [Labeo rohita]
MLVDPPHPTPAPDELEEDTSPEEVWASEVVKVLGSEEEKDFKAIEGHLDEASQKKEMDEHMMKLFCVTSPEGPKNETQHHVNVQPEGAKEQEKSATCSVHLGRREGQEKGGEENMEGEGAKR